MILIALGANLLSRFGLPEETLHAAGLELEQRGVEVLQWSRIWLSAPVPVSDQPTYRNAVISVKTSLNPRALFDVLKAIEKDFGRESAEKNAARVIDLDIIAYNKEIMNESDLVIPHPRLHERAFVLFPVHDIAPAWRHPETGKSLQQMIKEMPPGQEIKPLEEGAHVKAGS